MKAEITRLQKKLLEQEKKLQSTMKHLQLSKHQERVIFDQRECGWLPRTPPALGVPSAGLVIGGDSCAQGTSVGACAESRPGATRR